jgi:hypothetical protein
VEIPDIVKIIYEHSPYFSILIFGVVMAMAAQSSDSNSRVSRFELMQKDIGYIREIIANMDEKLDKAVKSTREEVRDHEGRIRTLERGQGALNERMKIISGLQAGWALVASAVAAFIGSQK